LGSSTDRPMKRTSNIFRIDVHILASFNDHDQETCCGYTLYQEECDGIDEVISLKQATKIKVFCMLRNAQEGEFFPHFGIRWIYYAPCKICVSQAEPVIQKHYEREPLRDLAGTDL